MMALQKTVTTDLLEIAYEENGDPGGVPVMLIHGWPDDVRTWDLVVEALAARGYRTFAPYVRGFGPTRFRNPATPRSGEIAALARDAIAVADVLGLERPRFVGHDWGARAAYSAAILCPDRFSGIVAVAVPYASNVGSHQLSYAQTRAYWYQWFFGTPRGAKTFGEDPIGFARELWQAWSPNWRFDAQTFERTAASFANPDFVEITIHSYRQRWGGAEGDPRYGADREQIESVPQIAIPTVTVMGEADGATLPEGAIGRDQYFDAPYRCEIIPVAGHFVQRERPETIVEAIVEGARVV